MVCMVTILPLISSYPLRIVAKALITFIFHRFILVLRQDPSIYLFIFLLSFISTLWFIQTGKSTRWLALFFLSINTRSGLLIGFSDPFVFQNPREFYEYHFLGTESGFSLYYLAVWSNFNLLHNSLSIAFPTQSYLLLYSFCACLLHSLIMWLIVLSRSTNNLHLLFFCFGSVSLF